MREAGLNPFMSTAGVAANNTSAAPAPSAPYAPTVKPDYVSPFSAIAPSVNNIGNDFMSTYMNMKMQNAQIEKFKRILIRLKPTLVLFQVIKKIKPSVKLIKMLLLLVLLVLKLN